MKKLVIFSSDLETYCQIIKAESTAACFSLFTGLCLANESRSINLFELVLHCALPVPWSQPR